MNTKRKFRRVTFGRKLNEKQLRSALRQTMREMAKDPAPEAAPSRLESVLIESSKTTVYLSGNGPGLEAVATAVRNKYGDAKVSKSSRADAFRLPRDLDSKRKE